MLGIRTACAKALKQEAGLIQDITSSKLITAKRYSAKIKRRGSQQGHTKEIGVHSDVDRKPHKRSQRVLHSISAPRLLFTQQMQIHMPTCKALQVLSAKTPPATSALCSKESLVPESLFSTPALCKPLSTSPQADSNCL